MAQVQGRGLVAPGVPTLSNSARFQTYSLHSRSVEIQEAAAEDVHRFVGLSQGRLRERPPETAEAAITCRIHPGLGSEPHLGTSDPRFVHPPRTDPALRGRRLPFNSPVDRLTPGCPPSHSKGGGWAFLPQPCPLRAGFFWEPRRASEEAWRAQNPRRGS